MSETLKRSVDSVRTSQESVTPDEILKIDSYERYEALRTNRKISGSSESFLRGAMARFLHDDYYFEPPGISEINTWIDKLNTDMGKKYGEGIFLRKIESPESNRKETETELSALKKSIEAESDSDSVSMREFHNIRDEKGWNVAYQYLCNTGVRVRRAGEVFLRGAISARVFKKFPKFLREEEANFLRNSKGKMIGAENQRIYFNKAIDRLNKEIDWLNEEAKKNYGAKGNFFKKFRYLEQ